MVDGWVVVFVWCVKRSAGCVRVLGVVGGVGLCGWVCVCVLGGPRGSTFSIVDWEGCAGGVCVCVCVCVCVGWSSRPHLCYGRHRGTCQGCVCVCVCLCVRTVFDKREGLCRSTSWEQARACVYVGARVCL